MNKIYVHAPGENWILDRYAEEWIRHNPDLVSQSPYDANILWMVDDWTWDRIDPLLLTNKTLVSTICHIDPNKYDFDAFRERDKYVDHYHAMSEKTANDLRKITDKPITPIQFWVNENIWKESEIDVDKLRSKYNLPRMKTLVGSFQRDTEGSDLVSPKLVKGPDLFCDYMEHLQSQIGKNLEVVLTGWRRQYVMKRLSRAEIKYHYFELCDFETMNDLYNCLDLYVVSSRIEGGPQAIPECAMTRTPIISRDVGLAPEILAPKSVNDNLSLAIPDMDYAYEKVQQYTIENHMKNFIDFFKRIYI